MEFVSRSHQDGLGRWFRMVGAPFLAWVLLMFGLGSATGEQPSYDLSKDLPSERPPSVGRVPRHGEPRATEALLESDPPHYSPSSLAPSTTGSSIGYRSRFTRLSTSVLRGASGQVPTPGQRFRMNLFDDADFPAVLVRVEPAGPDAWVASGFVEGVEASLVLLSIHGDGVAGEVTVPKRGRFTLRGSLSKGVRVDQMHTEPPRCATCSPLGEEQAAVKDITEGPRMKLLSLAPVLPPTTELVTMIDVLIVYTAQAVQGAGGEEALQALLRMAAAEANAVFQNSRAHVRFRVVHQQLVNYEEDASFATNLTRLRLPTDGFLDDVHALRETHKADLVCLVTESGDTGYGGLASVMTTASPASKPFGFSVVRRADAVGHYVFVHELCHNLGCQHDRENAQDRTGTLLPGVFHYSFGYRFTSEDVVYRTVMAYPPGEPVPFLSTPLIHFQQMPLGVDASLTNSAADNVRTVNATAPIVGAYNGLLVQSLAPKISWTAPNDGDAFRERDIIQLKVDATDSDGTVRQVEFYSGLTLIGVVQNPSSSSVALLWTNAPPGVHNVTARAVDDVGACSALVGRDISIRPSNDAFADASLVSGDDWTVTGNNAAATRETGEPQVGTNVGDGSVWYAWIAPRAGTVFITGKGHNSVPLVGVYSGSSVGSLSTAYRSAIFDTTQLTCITTVDVVAGQNVFISVDSLAGFDDTFTLSASYSLAAANDDFETPELLNGESVTAQGEAGFATAEPAEPLLNGVRGSKTVWYRWTAPKDGVVQASVSGTNSVWLIDVFTGSALSALSQPAGRQYVTDRTNGVSRVMFTAEAGKSYAIGVDGVSSLKGIFELAVSYLTAPRNDSFDQREILAGARVSLALNNLAATRETGEPSPAGLQGGKSLWFSWTAPVTGPVKVVVMGDRFTVLPDAFTGTNVTTLIPVNRGIQSAPDFSTTLTFKATLGQTYALVVDGINGRGGDITLSLETSNTPAQLSAGSVRLTAGGELQFQITGSEGQNYLVEQSADLVRWQSFRSGTLGARSETFATSLKLDGGSWFYRVLPQP